MRSRTSADSSGLVQPIRLSLSACVVVLLAICVAACGGDSDSGPTSEATASGREESDINTTQPGQNGGTDSGDDGNGDDGSDDDGSGGTGSGGGGSGDVSTELGDADDAVDVLLGQSYSTTEVGDGIGTDCSDERTNDPAIVFKDVYFGNPPALGAIVALCLFGFENDSPIEVVTMIGSEYEFRTEFVPTDGERGLLYPGSTCDGAEELDCDPARESRNLLFGDSERPIYSDDSGALVTNDWWYIPDVADALVEAGSFTITARQGDVTEVTEVPVRSRAEDAGVAYWLEDVSEGSPLFLVVGFQAGQRIPIGLYASTAPDPDFLCAGSYELISQVGTFDVPPYGVALLRIPDGVFALASEGEFLLTPPVSDLQAAPAIVDGRPSGDCVLDADIPVSEPVDTAVTTDDAGDATLPTSPTSDSTSEATSIPLRLGDSGERVERLQEALANFGYLEESDVDGSFGEGTESAVIAFQVDRGLEADGVAGPATHAALGIPY